MSKPLPYPHYDKSIRRCYVPVTNAARAELLACMRRREEAALQSEIDRLEARLRTAEESIRFHQKDAKFWRDQFNLLRESGK